MSVIKDDGTGYRLSVVAVVGHGDDQERLVLNRPLQFVYERVGNDFIGEDGPFRDVLFYQRGGGSFKAFGGSPITLRMKDGTTFIAQDHWWAGSVKGMADVIVGDVESLMKCYVFRGGQCIAQQDLAALRAAYTGPVYSYWDYEKVIKYDSERKALWGRVFKEERRGKAILSQARAKSRALKEAQSIISDISNALSRATTKAEAGR